MNFTNFKILPLLVFVAMLAFSVRLAEVAVGIAHVAGEAQAADEGKKNEPAKTETTSAEKPAVTPAAETPKEGTAAQTTKETPKDAVPIAAGDKPPAAEGAAEAKDAIEWVDAGDSDTQFSTVRHELYDNLAKRRDELDKREGDLVTREALLRAAEQEIDRKFNELSQLRGEIEKLLQKQSDEENGRIASLVKIYEGMKPADAARIFDTLDLDVLITVMSKMSERKLSPVLAQMNPERARTITIMMAQQKQLPQLPPAN